MRALFVIAAAAASLASVSATAGVMIGATGVSASAGLPAGYSAPTALGNIIDQSGLSATYVSGVTDFTTFTATTTACYACMGQGNYRELGGVDGVPATITFSFAGPVTLDSLVVWNQAGSASLNTFDLLDGNTVLGSFVMPGNSQDFPQPAATFSFNSVTLNAITLRVTSNFGYSGTIVNEVAFGGSVGGAVPEPATWAMMIGGFALAGAAMRRRRTAVSFA